MLTGHIGWTDQKISRKMFNELEFPNYLCLAGGQLCPAHDLYQAWTSSIHSATDTGHLESIVIDTSSLFCHNPAEQGRILQDRFSGCRSAVIAAFVRAVGPQWCGQWWTVDRSVQPARPPPAATALV